MNDSTKATLLTGPGQAAIAVIRLAGPGAPAIAAALAPAAPLAAGEFRHAILRRGNAVLDDALLVRIDATTFEFHVHGGHAVIEAVGAALQEMGCRMEAEGSALAWPGESVIAREVFSALSRAMTPSAVQLLAWQRTHLAAWAAGLTAQLAAGAPLWRIQSEIQWTLHRSTELAFVLQPARVAIVGPPNAGKSTLANALLGRPLSITSDTPGTTRDWVDATATFTTGPLEIAVTLVDTAGVRTTSDPIEAESIVRTFGQAQQADLVLAVVDGTAPPGDWAWLRRLEQSAARLLVVMNKSDLGGPIVQVPIARRCIPISARDHANLEALMQAALEELGVAELGVEYFAFTPRQRSLLHAAAGGDAQDLKPALQTLVEGGDDGG